MKWVRLLFFGAGASEAVRLSGWRAPLCLTVDSAASPAALAALVRAVEREPEFVPGVRRVRVLERGPGEAGSLTAEGVGDGWVRYEVEGTYGGLPWRVQFCKEWEADRRFVWRTEGGTGRPEQWGELALRPLEGGTRLELRAWTRSALPLLGGAGSLLVNPLFLGPTFSGWLGNLARAAEAGGL